MELHRGVDIKMLVTALLRIGFLDGIVALVANGISEHN